MRNKDDLQGFKARVYQNSGQAIWVNPSYGPIFGMGHDFLISNNAHSSSSSFARFGGTYKPPANYTYHTAECDALLAGTYQFNATEVEVYYLP